ncbi:PAS domain-containing protein OS=Streptomyces antimycoticus OX=68175 GN=SANT12839_063080 PE=4 SV=1 [Streptomyces antimycoticus]
MIAKWGALKPAQATFRSGGSASTRSWRCRSGRGGRRSGWPCSPVTTAPSRFAQDDMVLAEEITTRAAVCVDNAHRFTRERDTALALQRSLLPRTLPQPPAVEVASRYLPAAVRGGGRGLVRRHPATPGHGSRWSWATWSATASRRRPPSAGCGRQSYPRRRRSAAGRTAHPPGRPGDPSGRGDRGEKPGMWGPPVCTRSTTPSRTAAHSPPAGHPPGPGQADDTVESLPRCRPDRRWGSADCPSSRWRPSCPRTPVLALYTNGLMHARVEPPGSTRAGCC